MHRRGTRRGPRAVVRDRPQWECGCRRALCGPGVRSAASAVAGQSSRGRGLTQPAFGVGYPPRSLRRGDRHSPARRVPCSTPADERSRLDRLGSARCCSPWPPPGPRRRRRDPGHPTGGGPSAARRRRRAARRRGARAGGQLWSPARAAGVVEAARSPDTRCRWPAVWSLAPGAGRGRRGCRGRSRARTAAEDPFWSPRHSAAVGRGRCGGATPRPSRLGRRRAGGGGWQPPAPRADARTALPVDLPRPARGVVKVGAAVPPLTAVRSPRWTAQALGRPARDRRWESPSSRRAARQAGAGPPACSGPPAAGSGCALGSRRAEAYTVPGGVALLVVGRCGAA